jgi:hypothetical protein
MTDHPVELWKQLCEEAATEYNPEKLHELVAKINTLLEQKLTRDKNSDAESHSARFP